MILIRYILDILAEDKKFKNFGDSIQDSIWTSNYNLTTKVESNNYLACK